MSTARGRYILLHVVYNMYITKGFLTAPIRPGHVWHLSSPYRATPLRAIDRERCNPNDAKCIRGNAGITSFFEDARTQ
jgi:hypothetical protein